MLCLPADQASSLMFDTVERGTSIAQFSVGSGVLGGKLEGTLPVRNRFVQIAACHESTGKMSTKRCIVAPDRDRPAQQLDGLARVAAQESDETSPLKRFGIVRLMLENFPEACVGLRAAAMAYVIVPVPNQPGDIGGIVPCARLRIRIRRFHRFHRRSRLRLLESLHSSRFKVIETPNRSSNCDPIR